MDITIHPRLLSGTVHAIPSKSQAHRLLICAAFADSPTVLICRETNEDIAATARCLNALGAKITRNEAGYAVIPIKDIPDCATLDCGESGSTLRFLLPVAGALGVDATFLLRGRLPQRPLHPLWEEMERMGCCLSRPTHDTVRCTGHLMCGDYSIDGSVSSQFISGLLFACALLSGTSHIHITGKLESRPYVDMTLQAMAQFGVTVTDMTVIGSTFRSPGRLTVEGDWSNAAFFLTGKAMGCDLTVTGLDSSSVQGDRACADILFADHFPSSVSAKDIPDLVPILAVAAAVMGGCEFTDVGRLRLKESDRIASVKAMLEALGGRADATKNTLKVYPARFTGGIVDACGDHRIAMAAAIAACTAEDDVTILGAQCVNKSYPSFWEVYKQTGGQYEQCIR